MSLFLEVLQRITSILPIYIPQFIYVSIYVKVASLSSSLDDVIANQHLQFSAFNLVEYRETVFEAEL